MTEKEREKLMRRIVGHSYRKEEEIMTVALIDIAFQLTRIADNTEPPQITINRTMGLSSIEELEPTPDVPTDVPAGTPAGALVEAVDKIKEEVGSYDMISSAQVFDILNKVFSRP